jgi:adenylate cyclase
VGNFGGSTIFDYRALGDPVNTASRLEGANKHLGTLVCISHATLASCASVAVRPVGRLRLAGKTQPLMAYEPLDGASGIADDAAYRRAFELMSCGSEAAVDAFAGLAAERPDDPLVSLHLRRLGAGCRDDIVELAGK